MNTNPAATTILCYGDSNTWGQTPDNQPRYAANVRWTGVLQTTLGEQFYIIEEGLSSRTTDLEYPKKLGRNGKTYLEPCIDSHKPLDIVIVMLGTNDLKVEFNRSVEQIAAALGDLVAIIRAKTTKPNGEPAKIILVSPIHINQDGQSFQQWRHGNYDDESVQKSCHLAEAIEALAKETGCEFVDAATVAKGGDDGIHLEPDSHPALGKLLAQKVQTLIQ